MSWHQLARSIRRGRPEPERQPELPRFATDGSWAESAPVLDPSRLSEPERLALVRRAIDALPELYRVALILCDAEGLSHGEAAEALGIPERTFRLRLHRARQGLLSLLRPHLAPQLH